MTFSPVGADLHLHSYYSDGTFPPQEIVARAASCRLSPIALTDHDTVAGIPEALQSASEGGIEIIPGVELSVDEGNHQVHILGYFIRWDDPTLQGILHLQEQRRWERLEEMLRRLLRIGISLSPEDVVRVAGKGTVGRLHVAQALLLRGDVRSLDEAFERYLGVGRPAYVPRFGFTIHDAIGAIRNAGGVPVLAHPGRDRLDLLHPLIQAGLQGIEVFHPSHTSEDILRLTRLAATHGLLITGGSDCHGLAKGEILMGQVRLPLTYVEQLKQAAAV
jgi:predicted metal-dependent phosphoesterase TrpH